MAGNLKVLFVDDDDFSRAYYSKILELAGFGNVSLLENGSQLIDALQDKPDIIFLDYQLNDYNGSELLEKINQRSPETLTVILSSQQDVKISVELMNNGAFDYVVKSEQDVDKFKQIFERVTELQSPVLKSLGSLRYAYMAQKEKTKAQEAFASELHDSINPLLSISKLFLEMALNNPAKSGDYINESKEIITSAIEEVRNLTHQVFFNRQQAENLETQLGKFLHLLEKQSMILFDIRVDIQDLNNVLSPAEQNDFLMLFKEIVNNLIKYSETEKAEIKIEKDKHYLNLIVKDYGKGFDSSQISSGIGMNSITQRIHRLKGTYVLSSKPGEGCCWSINIPVNGLHSATFT
ncbi:response regulator [Lacibacter luteus]|uniref:histidine kinase n=1 Tax=Lacibacter luteus TaxID=2508719 RepID=A0A4V1M7D8_9BACT|nr:response regulator [Lacibacter luteus]RXK59394.1 response regulator [Lacibacter luteus]